MYQRQGLCLTSSPSSYCQIRGLSVWDRETLVPCLTSRARPLEPVLHPGPVSPVAGTLPLSFSVGDGIHYFGSSGSTGPGPVRGPHRNVL